MPRTYLKYFSREVVNSQGSEYFINALSKADGKIFETNIKNICVEKDMYVIPGSTEAQRQFLENMYSELYEKPYDGLYKILTDDTKETMTLRERYLFISFVVSMFFRNNSWATGYNHLMDETYAKAYQLSKGSNQDSFFFGEQEISIVGKTLEELQKKNREDDRPMLALSSAQKIFQLIRLRVINDVVTIVKTPGDYEYITSDNPVSFRAEDIKKRPIPLDPTNTLSVPIDKNHLLQLRPWGHELDRTMLGRTTEHSIISAITIASNNEFQFSQSGKFILGTETDIKNFKPDPTGELLRNRLRQIMGS